MSRVRDFIAEMEQLGVVQKAPTQYINPLVVVVKPNGDIRLCLDAHEINKKMANDHAQPPTIDEVLAKIGHRRVFSKLDISQAFWQIPLQRESCQYTGFLFGNQSYIFRRMPFGIKTAGASFTRAIEAAMGGKLMDNVIVYLDDILIASDTEEQHMEHLRVVFDSLEHAGFKLNRNKCEFASESVEFLGHDITKEDVQISEETKQAILNFTRPRCKRELQSFLGLINWDRRFVKNLARLTKPLEELLRKNAKFVWDSAKEKAFVDIKREFREAERLFLIDPKLEYGILRPMHRHTDWEPACTSSTPRETNIQSLTSVAQ